MDSVMQDAILSRIHFVEYVSNKTEDVSLKLFNMIKELNESRPIAKHPSRECLSEFDNKYQYECNNPISYLMGKLCL